MNLTIKRDLAGVDWNEVAEMYWDAMVVDEAGDPLPRPTGDAWAEHLRKTRGEFEGSDLTCLAMLDGKCVGGVHALTDGVRDAAIFGFAVHRGYRNRGIGTRMMTELLNDLRHVSVILHASESSEGISRKLGFRTIRRAMALRYWEREYVD